MSMLGNIASIQNTQTPNIENTQPSSASRTVAPIQLGNDSHVVTPGAQETQPAGQGGQAFPTTLDPNATANASAQLNVSTGATQTQPIQNRTVAPAGQKKAPPPKSYNFTFKQLDDISKGKYNVGEIALDKKGKLTKINNHVHYTDKNNVVTTPQDNTRLRRQVYDCIMDKYKFKGEAKSALEKLLFAEGRASLSLGRDELRLILKGAEDGRLASDYDGLIADLSDIRAFKTGDMDDPNDASKMNERGLIKGLKTDFENNVVRQVSKNAKFDIAYSLVDNEQTGFNFTDGMGSATGLLNAVYQKTTDGLGKLYTLAPNRIDVDNRLQVYRKDVLNLASREMARLVMENCPTESLRTALADRLMPQIVNYCKERLDRRNPVHANPGAILKHNSENPEAKMYIRQTFNNCDRGGKPERLGSQFCFFNSVFNAVIASNNKNAHDKLAGMFDEGGFTLSDNDRKSHTYSYDDPNLPGTGSYSLYEEAMNAHFKLVKGPKYNYGGGEPRDAGRVLGMVEVDAEGVSKYAFPDGADGQNEAELQRNCVNELNEHIQNGKFVIYGTGDHFVAIKGLELLENGSVKMSVVDDTANANYMFEYDKILAKDQFKRVCENLSFTVLEFPPAE